MKKIYTLAAIIAVLATIATSTLTGKATKPNLDEDKRVVEQIEVTPSTTTTSTKVEESEPETQPATEPATAPVQEEAPKKQLISIKGTDVAYENTTASAAQAFIDANPDMAATDRDSAFNGGDGLPTWFAGHDYGKFGAIKGLVTGDEITVYDEHGQAHVYVVSVTRTISLDFVDVAGYTRTEDDAIFLTDAMSASTESLILQTCASEVVNNSFDCFFVIAYPK